MTNPIETNLLLEGYFPDELPPCFTTQSFSNFIKDFKKYDEWSKFAKKNSSDCSYYSIPKQINSRRLLAIPNPIFQTILCHAICQNWNDIERGIESDIAVTKPKFPMNGPFFNNEIFEIRNEIFVKSATNYRFLLSTDISRFYSTIYTHSISWALHGELPQKQWKNYDYCGNLIDLLIRNCRLQKTHGIPTGPATSYIIHEIIASAVDKVVEEQFKNESLNLVGLRYIDDYELFFQTEEEAEKGLDYINFALGKYELELNPIKTKITKLPVPIEVEWAQYIRNYKFPEVIKEPEDVIFQKRELISYFSRVYEFYNKYSNHNVLLFAVKQLLDTNKVLIHKNNWPLFESLLLNTISFNATCINTIINLLLKYEEMGSNYPIDKKKLHEAIEYLILNTLPTNTYEICWALWSAKVFSINLSEKVGKKLSSIDNPFIGLLALDINNKGKLSGYDESIWNQHLNKEQLYSNKWILVYEIVNKKWITIPRNYLIGDTQFSELFQHKVSFYDENILVPKIPTKKFNS